MSAIGTLLLSIVFAAPQLNGPLPGPLPLFPPDNWWNADISAAPVDSASASFINYVGFTQGLHPDFGGNECGGCDANYGMSYITVDNSQPLKSVEFYYDDQSDGVNHGTGQSFPFYPIPDQAITLPHWVEGGQPGNVDLRASADRHILIVNTQTKGLYELWNCWYDTGAAQWRCGSGAFFDMTTNGHRPDTWTSADAAGLAILPGLVRYDEAQGPAEIGHAFRVTVRATNGYVAPASHDAGSTPGALPMGARLRLKPGKDISGFPADIQRIFRAMKKHGLIVADNGTDLYVTGNYDTRWDNDVLNPAFDALEGGDFEVIQLGWIPQAVPPAITAISPAAGTTAGGTTVELSGSGLQAGATVDIGGSAAMVIAVPDSAHIVAVTAAHAAGTVAVSATNPNASAATLPAAFTYCAGAPATPVVTAPLWAAIGASGLQASTPPTGGNSFRWTVVGGSLAGGQNTPAITFGAGAPGTTMLVSAVAIPGGGCASATGWASVQVDFLDVPPAHGFHDYVDTVARNGITSGCGGGSYCPDSVVTRAQMAVFLLRGEHGWTYVPPPATGQVFSDVSQQSFAAAWIEALAAEGITGGCGFGAYCPGSPVTRAQMSVFLLRARHGAGYAPPPATGAVFGDVPANGFAADWIEQLAAEGITGGCGFGDFCPDNPVTRGQMAVFLVRAFNLQ